MSMDASGYCGFCARFCLLLYFNAMPSTETIQTLIPPGFIDLGAGEPQPELLPLDLLRPVLPHVGWARR
ncbi:MAG: hypothetical protein IPJ47_10170 [Anaerolineales bacterium]|nr:hypothetical protein [Anaerolineales bacterium]